MALEGAANYIDVLGGDSRKYRQVLAQPEQEPVAWICEGSSSDEKHAIDYWTGDIDDLPIGTQLYTSPPPQRTWVGLTDEEALDCLPGLAMYADCVKFWENIEAKLKEKNEH